MPIDKNDITAQEKLEKLLKEHQDDPKTSLLILRAEQIGEEIIKEQSYKN